MWHFKVLFHIFVIKDDVPFMEEFQKGSLLIITFIFVVNSDEMRVYAHVCVSVCPRKININRFTSSVNISIGYVVSIIESCIVQGLITLVFLLELIKRMQYILRSFQKAFVFIISTDTASMLSFCNIMAKGFRFVYLAFGFS